MKEESGKWKAEVLTADQAFERVEPFLPDAGVTRVAEITGLDRIGIPVFVSVRPLAKTLSVDSGKGVTVAAARASAAYESIERFVGESADVPYSVASVRELLMQAARPVLDLPRVRGSVLDKDRRYRWAWVRDVGLSGDGEPMPVPWQAVRLMPGDERPLAEMVWQSTSNGLAAGSSREDAVFQALCEVIERDGCACHQWAGTQLGDAWLASKCFDPESVSAECDDLLDRIEAAGCAVRCFDFSMPDTGLPVVMVYLLDREDSSAGIYKGYGCHPRAEVALRRAITEAVQARCVIIAGARDDIGSKRHAEIRGQDGAAVTRALLEMDPTTEARRHEGVKPDWESVVVALAENGWDRILVYDFDVHCAAHVVRVMVPGLAGYWTPEATACDRMKEFAALERMK